MHSLSTHYGQHSSILPLICRTGHISESLPQVIIHYNLISHKNPLPFQYTTTKKTTSPHLAPGGRSIIFILP